MYKNGDKTDSTMYTILSNILGSRKLFGFIIVDFVATGELLLIYSTFFKYSGKIGIK